MINRDHTLLLPVNAKSPACRNFDYPFERNFSSVPNPLPIQIERGIEKSADDIFFIFVFAGQDGRLFVGFCQNSILHAFANIIEAAVTGNLFEKLVLRFHIFEKASH